MGLFELTGVFLATLVWWQVIIVIALFGASAFILNKDEKGWASAPIIGVIAWGYWNTRDQVLDVSIAAIIGTLIGFLILGVIWASFKWYKKVVYNAKKGYSKPDASKHTGEIMVWIGYWPLSITIYVFTEFLADFWDKLMESIVKRYNKWTDAIYEKYTPKKEN